MCFISSRVISATSYLRAQLLYRKPLLTQQTRRKRVMLHKKTHQQMLAADICVPECACADKRTVKRSFCRFRKTSGHIDTIPFAAFPCSLDIL
ncbi:MAG TPA: hypothetical protein PLT66_03950 [Bacillota bacterium]|nr:hypothetical protein [Bacillota bacterium]